MHIHEQVPDPEEAMAVASTGPTEKQPLLPAAGAAAAGAAAAASGQAAATQGPAPAAPAPSSGSAQNVQLQQVVIFITNMYHRLSRV